jgi:hypothetical protein
MRVSGHLAIRCRMVERSRLQTFAARALPRCQDESALAALSDGFEALGLTSVAVSPVSRRHRA